MKFLKQLFDFYINSSIHVALSCFALVQITFLTIKIPIDYSVSLFAFFGTIVGYNFVKYDALARTQKLQMTSQLKAIAVLSFISLIATVYYFFQLQKITQLIGITVFAITLLYTLPFFPNKKNARNWAGIKIYIVALCWVGVTVVLPIINAKIPITPDFYIKCLQRFFLIFVLILIFEIIDLQQDDPHLKTVPQQIGVRRTKILGYILVLIFCILNLFNSNCKNQFQIQSFDIVIAIVIAFFLFFATENKSKYYTSFWVESVPIFWWLMVLYFIQ